MNGTHQNAARYFMVVVKQEIREIEEIAETHESANLFFILPLQIFQKISIHLVLQIRLNL